MKPTRILSPLLLASAIGTSTLLSQEPAPPVTAPHPPPAPPEMAISVTPPAPGEPHAVFHIHRDGQNVIRRVNAGNASEVLVNAEAAATITHGSVADTTAGPVTWLGIATEEVSEEVRAQLPLGEGTGLLIRTVIPDSPAAAAGLKRNDVLVRLEDQILVNPAQLRTLVANRKEGETVKLTVLQQGKENVLTAKLGQRQGGEDAWGVTSVITEGGPARDILNFTTKPMVLQSRALVVDPKGNVITVPAPTLQSAEATRLQEELKKAGVSRAVSEDVNRTLADVRRQLEQSKAELEKNKTETVKRLEESAEELAKALQRAKEAMEQTRSKLEKPAPSNDHEAPTGANESSESKQ